MAMIRAFLCGLTQANLLIWANSAGCTDLEVLLGLPE